MNAALKILTCLPLMLYYILEHLVLLLVPKRLRFKDVKGETVLITGAGNGVGRELALQFSELGCRIVLVDINREWMEQTKKMISAKSGEVYAYVCDVSKRDAIYSMAEKVKREVGTVTILVNNAGIVTGKRFLDCPDEKIQKTFEVNTLAHFWTCKAFLPDMIKNNHGHLVSIASLAGHAGAPRLTDYCSSKFAAVGFEESIRNELISEKVTGVKTTIACPYQISTGLFDGFNARVCGPLTPEYVADAVISAVRVNQEVLLLPWWFWFFLCLRWVVPISSMTVLLDTLGLFNCMDEFTGRKKVD